jgi:hypothetical protein
MASIYILGHELQGDFFDADFVDLYEAAAKRMRDQAAAGEHVHYNSLGEAYRAQCKLVKDYFDGVFGKGTADELFDGSNNIKEHMQAFAELVDLAQKNQKETNDFINKYTQRQNAAVRHIEEKRRRGNRR